MASNRRPHDALGGGGSFLDAFGERGMKNTVKKLEKLNEEMRREIEDVLKSNTSLAAEIAGLRRRIEMLESRFPTMQPGWPNPIYPMWPNWPTPIYCRTQADSQAKLNVTHVL